jgi:hypothetical protein
MLRLFGGAYAQRLLPGMKGIQVTGGMVDGVYSSFAKNETGYYFGAAMATYAKHGNKWVIGGEYLERYYPYKDSRLPKAQFTAEGGYFLNILSSPSKVFFLSLGGSALAGYETINWGISYCSTARRSKTVTVSYTEGRLLWSWKHT